MARYLIADAVRELRLALDNAPPQATTAEWVATSEQAGVSSQSGGYVNAEGSYVAPEDNSADRAIRGVVAKLEASPTQTFNKVVVRWARSKIPFMRGRVSVETIFDEAIVPRGPDDAIYQVAADARLEFWKMLGNVGEDFAAERNVANIHNQTKWFGPHRRILAIRSATSLMLATDGLSTPWAGVADRENGVACELFMEFDASELANVQADGWADLLISIGDLVADGYRVADDVEKHGAILFCRLSDEYNPMSWMILSRDIRLIEGMPFGSVPLIRATPIADAQIEGVDQSDKWSANAAKSALANKKI